MHPHQDRGKENFASCSRNLLGTKPIAGDNARTTIPLSPLFAGTPLQEPETTLARTMTANGHPHDPWGIFEAITAICDGVAGADQKPFAMLKSDEFILAVKHLERWERERVADLVNCVLGRGTFKAVFPYAVRSLSTINQVGSKSSCPTTRCGAAKTHADVNVGSISRSDPKVSFRS